MNKKERQLIFDKYNGKCAYCGCDLVKGWHADHIEPVGRTFKYIRDESGRVIHEDGEPLKDSFMRFPDRDCLENFNPACASCNIQKHSLDIEGFRHSIQQFIHSLNSYTTTYKIAKRYGLVKETGIEVKFYFETLS